MISIILLRMYFLSKNFPCLCDTFPVGVVLILDKLLPIHEIISVALWPSDVLGIMTFNLLDTFNLRMRSSILCVKFAGTFFGVLRMRSAVRLLTRTAPAMCPPSIWSSSFSLVVFVFIPQFFISSLPAVSTFWIYHLTMPTLFFLCIIHIQNRDFAVMWTDSLGDSSLRRESLRTQFCGHCFQTHTSELLWVNYLAYIHVPCHRQIPLK